MKSERLLRNLNDIDIKYILEVAPIAAGKGLSRKRIVALILAAALALFLVSCGVVAVIYGDSIQSWFEFYWHRITGQDMEVEQTAIIDHLSQDIGVSFSDGAVTVSVDSATVSEDIFYLLIRVEGLPFSGRKNYDFKERDIEITPDPAAESGGMGSFGIRFLGLDGDGSALFLLDHQTSPYSGFEDGTEDYEISLILTDLIMQNHSKTKIVAEGVWSFRFTLDRSAVPESIHLPDTVVPGIDLNTGEIVDVILTDIVLTNTGIRFKYLSNNGSIDLHLGLHWISPLLTNGKRIEDGTGSGVHIDGSNLLSYSWHWPIPVDLEDIVSVWIGDTEIVIP